MKTLVSQKVWKALVFLWVGGVGFGAVSALANFEVSGSVSIHATADFYAPLSPYGTWVEVGSYGRCWRPVGIAVDWRPYCYGHWVWTDCGWYWASDEPWGWACFHYGWWVYDPVYAWIWVPGVEWGPAWVSWRVGGGYIGWAPLAPHGVVIAGPRFVFVETSRFSDPIRPNSVVVNNTTIVNKTTVVNNIRRETRTLGGGMHGKVVVNEGPGLGAFDKAAASKMRRVPIQDAARQASVPDRKSPPAGVEPLGVKPRGAPGAPGDMHEQQRGRPAPSGRDAAAPERRGHGGEHERSDKPHGNHEN